MERSAIVIFHRDEWYGIENGEGKEEENLIPKEYNEKH